MAEARPPLGYRLTDTCLEALREEKAVGVQQQAIARAIGCHPATLSQWMRRQIPIREALTNPRVAALARYLERPVETVVERMPAMARRPPPPGRRRREWIVVPVLDRAALAAALTALDQAGATLWTVLPDAAGYTVIAWRMRAAAGDAPAP